MCLHSWKLSSKEETQLHLRESYAHQIIYDRMMQFKGKDVTMTHADPRTSILMQLRVGDVGFREKGKLKNLEKNLWSNVRTNNKLNPHMVPRWN